MKNKKLIYILFAIAVLTVIATEGMEINKLDDETKRLCLWYANLDHKKEIADERYEKMNYRWTSFNWYESCLNHIEKIYANK